MAGLGLTRRRAAALAAAAAATPARAQAGRPNILWLVSEDNGPYLGAYGDRLAHTPHIDALAARGLTYERAYCTAPVCAPSRFAILTGLFAETCGPAHHMRARASLPPETRTYPELLRAAGYFCSNAAKTDYNCDVDPAKIWDDLGPEAHWRGKAAGQPFMAVFNHETTHESRLFRPTPGRVTPDHVTLPPFAPDTPAIRADYASYYNLMERMDEEIGARLAELEAAGLADDTIVFYYADNGGALLRSKRYCYDEGLRCPLVVYAPPKWRHLLPATPGSRMAEPVSFADLAPTVLSIAGLKPPPTMQGQAFLGSHRRPPRRFAASMRGRMDERYDFVRTVTDGRWRYIRNYHPHRIWGQHVGFEWLARGYQDFERVWRAGRLGPAQARFFQEKPFEELYDLREDPHQVRNRVGDRAAARPLAALRRALDAHMLAVSDNGFIPEGLRLEGYHASRDRAAYPLPRIMALAATAARREAKDRSQLQAALASANDIERYWGAMGLLMLGPAAKPSAARLHAAMTGDRVAQVRVVAAEAVAGLGDPAGVAVLAGLVETGGTWPALQALNALTALGETARPALPVIEKAAQSEQIYIRTAGRYLSAILNGTYDPSMAVFELQRVGL